MPLPTTASLHVDELLTNMSIAYAQDEENYVAHKIFAEIEGNYPTGLYRVFPKGHFFRSDAGLVTSGAETRRKDFEAAQATYTLEDWGLHHDVSDRDREAARDVNMDQWVTQLLTTDLLIRREIRFAEMFLRSTSGWTFMRQGTVDFVKWNDPASAPVDNVNLWLDDAGERTGRRFNVGVFGPRVWTALKNNAQILARILGGATVATPAQVNEDLIASLFELDEVYVARAAQNTAAQGVPGTDTFTGAYIVDDVALFAYRTKTPMLKEPSAGYMITSSRFDGVKVGGGAAIKNYRMENIGGGSDRYEGFSAFGGVMSAADAALLAWDVL
jgi:hypothetical protein